jgi:Phage tail lysozyme
MKSVAHSFAGSLALLLVASCTTEIEQDPNPEPPLAMSEAASANNTETAYNFFRAKGLTKDQAAGIVGNLMQESSVNPNSVQYDGGPGRGIAQWSVGGRWDTSHDDNVTWYANEHGLNRWALTTQLDFVWYELTTFGYGYSTLKASTTVTGAELAFQDKYEICGECDESTRIKYADEVLADYGGDKTGGGGGGSPKGCYSDTLGKEEAANACVQSKYDDLWYQCDNGSWVDRWSDPTACSSVHAL